MHLRMHITCRNDDEQDGGGGCREISSWRLHWFIITIIYYNNYFGFDDREQVTSD